MKDVCFLFNPGEHRIDVFYCGKPVRGSPFHANVYDWSKINVVNLPGKGNVRKPVEFESKFCQLLHLLWLIARFFWLRLEQFFTRKQVELEMQLHLI